MLNVVLVEPEIAGNTGNAIRLCANTGARLHLVEPLGFSMASAPLKRAGLDYHDLADVHVHADWDALEQALPAGGERYAFTSRATRRFDRVAYGEHDVIVFGAEGAGLSEAVLGRFDADHRLALPMRPGNRSLNLANSVAIVVFEAWRQHDFDGSVLNQAPPVESLGADSANG